MKKYILLLLIALIISFSPSIYAGTDGKAGTCVGQFLKIGAGARPCGMGEAFSAVADDVNAIYWNPAGLVQVEGNEASFMHNEWLYDLKYEFLASCFPQTYSIYGISLSYLRMGDLEGQDKDENPTGSFGAYDTILNLSYATYPMDESLSVGLTGKIIHQKIEQEKTTAIGLDLGTLYYPPQIKNLKLGLVIQNIGTRLKFVQKKESLPMIGRIGLACKLMNERLLFATDLVKPADNDLRLNSGLEYHPYPLLLIFRLGYNSNQDLGRGFSFGLGFNIRGLKIDYSLVPYGNIDNSHRLSLTTKF